jgi:hypothetical protein
MEEVEEDGHAMDTYDGIHFGWNGGRVATMMMVMVTFITGLRPGLVLLCFT